MKHIKRIQPTQDSTLAQQCYDQLQDYIIDGVFSPGYKLRVEELKEQLGIGQSPIRGLIPLGGFWFGRNRRK